MKKNLYRTRIDGPFDEKVLKFLSSLEEDLWIAEEDIVGTEVHNIMLYEQKILKKNEIKLILSSLEKIKVKLLKNQLDFDFSFEDIHPFIEKCVIEDIGIDIGGKLHTGRSRNDQVSVDIRLKIRDELNFLSEKIFDFFDVLLTLSQNSINIFMPLYTHLQRGQLGVFSHYINNYIAQILRFLERIDEIYKRINTNPLGACAIGGTSININRKRTAELLGFDSVINNSIDAISSRDYIFETLMLLSLVATQFSRISEDLLIWSSKEFDFIELDDKFCSVSSVMPQKKNPDTVELIRSKCSKIISNSFTMSMIIKAIPTGYFRDFQELKPLVKNSFDVTFSIINMLIGLFSTIKIKSERMIAALKDSYILALDLAELLVKECGIPFRISHQIVAKLVKDSKHYNDIIDKGRIENVILEETNNKIILPDKIIESLKSFNTCLEKRVSQGSPSKLEVEKTIEDLKQKRNSTHTQYLIRVESINEAKKLREDLIKELTS